jgi:hypothetical protein
MGEEFEELQEFKEFKERSQESGVRRRAVGVIAGAKLFLSK